MLRIVFLLSLFSFIGKAQVVDNFTDGDFTQSPVWEGSSSQFIVNGSSQLQLNSSGTDTSYLSSNCTSIDSTEWNFWVKLSFAPSDNNYAKIYLVSDQNNLKAALNGYFIRLGENGSFDSVDLWEQTGKTDTKLIDGKDGRCAKSTNTLRIKVTRSSSGNWKVYSDTLGGVDYVLEGTVVDTKHSTAVAFGVSCKYTTSNATKFYFDDFYVGSIRIDTITPKVMKAFAISPTTVDVYFNESIEQITATSIGNYTVNEDIGNPFSAQLDAANTSLVHLSFANTLQESKKYQLEIINVKDKAGNKIVAASVAFVLPESSKANDIVINEILSDPKTGGVDFVELYNKSNKTFDLSTLTLSSIDTLTNKLSSIHSISSSRLLFYPQQYLLLSTNANVVKSQYNTNNPAAFIDMAGFPAMNIASGIVVLADTSKQVIDRFDYKQSMHFPLLNLTKGVSLERISFNVVTNDGKNWHSAAASVGYATPGYENSQAVSTDSGKEVTLSLDIFSPDNDGYNDALGINYQFDLPGYVANVSIYSSGGILVRNVVANELLGTSGVCFWDGINNNRELCPIGMYIVYFEVFNTSGSVKSYKKVAVLSHKN